MIDNNTAEAISVRLIKLADGTLIDPSTKEPISGPLAAPRRGTREEKSSDPVDEGEDEEEDDAPDDITIKPTARRSIMDLALAPAQMAVVNNVLVYTLWGLPDDEIALQCNCTVHQVRIVRDLDDYHRMHDALIEGLQAAQQSSVQGIIAQAAPRAAKQIIGLMKNKSADIKMTSAKDILDRAGHRPADRVEHTHNVFGNHELVIRVIKESERDALPTLELTPNA